MKRSSLLICLFLVLLLLPGGAAAGASSLTLISITPSSGETNTTVNITSLSGTNFASSAGMRLKSSYKDIDIVGSVTSVDSTRIVGTFNLDKQLPGVYQVCVYNNASTYACGLTFTIKTTAETGTSSIFFETYPPGATVMLNGTTIGTSVFTYYNATPGTYKVVIRKSGYEEYSGSVTVLEGKRARFYAPLTLLGAGSKTATAVPVSTATTIRKSTMKVPTTWPSTTPTPESPVDTMTVLGAAGFGVGLVVFRRR